MEKQDKALKQSSERIESAKDLRVYKLAYQLAMDIFEATRSFPPEEKYALTGQIRRSSRSISEKLGPNVAMKLISLAN